MDEGRECREKHTNTHTECSYDIEALRNIVKLHVLLAVGFYGNVLFKMGL